MHNSKNEYLILNTHIWASAFECRAVGAAQPLESDRVLMMHLHICPDAFCDITQGWFPDLCWHKDSEK